MYECIQSREEFFGAPMHYSFVLGVWFAHAVEGILLQSVLRMKELIERIDPRLAPEAIASARENSLSLLQS